jgi:hypothetical protein
MAVTILRRPTSLYPVYNRNSFKLVDSKSANADFKYIVRIFIRYSSTSTYTQVGTTFPVYPMSDGSLEFDANPILTNYVLNNYNKDFVGINYTGSMFESYYQITTQDSINIGEQPCTFFTSIFLFDGALPTYTEVNYTGYTLSNIIPNSTTTINRSISNIPTNLTLKLTDKYTADFFLNNTISIYVNKIMLTINTIEGEYNYSYTIPNQTDKFDKCVASVAIGPANLTGITFSGLTSRLKQPFTYNVLDYKIWLVNNKGKQCTVKYNIKIDCNTKNIKGFERSWLIYKSKYGGWSYLLFNMKKSTLLDVKKNTYDRRLNESDTYNSRGLTTFNTSINKVYKMNTDWISIDQESYFEDLFSSPQVYKLTSSNIYNQLTQIIIKDGTYPIYNHIDDKLFQYQIEITECINQNKQLR